MLLIDVRTRARSRRDPRIEAAPRIGDHGSLRSPRCRPPRRALEVIASTIAAAMGLQSERTPGTVKPDRA
jgi:hypothetical protein